MPCSCSLKNSSSVRYSSDRGPDREEPKGEKIVFDEEEEEEEEADAEEKAGRMGDKEEDEAADVMTTVASSRLRDWAAGVVEEAV